MRAQTILAGLLVFALLSGCSGGGGSSSPSSSGTDGGSSSGSTSGGTSGGPGGSAPGWNATTVTGSFESTPGGASGATGAIKSFTVAANLTEVWLNVTITSTIPSGTPATEFEIDFRDSAHQDSVNTPPQGTAVTQAGKVQIYVAAPLGGMWTMSIFSSNSAQPGVPAGVPNQGTYELIVNSHV
jgi:hypothetical protein